jgi:hypothetical protein
VRARVLSERTSKSWEKLRRDRPLNLLKDSAGKLCLEGLRGVVSCVQVDEFHVEEHLVISQISSKEEQTVGILRGEFANP